MPFCQNCGKELNSNAKFCDGCGTPISAGNNQRKTSYEGEIRKCPNCGELLGAFITQCHSCGYELREVKAANSIREFATKLEEIESERAKSSNKLKFSPTTILSNAIEHTTNISSTDEKKISLIRNFSIPNTKEDIYEFMILAASNIDLKVYGIDSNTISATAKGVSDAWLAKFEQSYQKALFAFGTSPEFQGIKNLYETKLSQIKKAKWQLPLLLIGVFGGIFLLIGIIFLILGLTGSL